MLISTLKRFISILSCTGVVLHTVSLKMIRNELTAFFQQYPYSSNALFSLVLVALEKGLENEFECPCTTGLAVGLFTSCLLLPMFISFVFGLYLLNIQCNSSLKRSKNIWKCLSCCVPAAIWIVLFLSDGRYVACLHTVINLKTEGGMTERVTNKNNPTWLWCDHSQTVTKDQPNVLSSYFISKLCGFSLLFLISIVALCYKCFKFKFLDFSDELPCCTAHGQTCGSAHCRKCCEAHKHTCCERHKNMACLAHPPNDIPADSLLLVNRNQNDKPHGPCTKINCPCLCHQDCNCECHKP